MKPVDQTMFGEKGDCVRACVASILDLTIEEVPNFLLGDDGEVDEAGATNRMTEWLSNRGKILKHVYLWHRIRECLTPRGYYMAGGKSPRGVGGGHMVVYFSTVLSHDPHPDQTGLAGEPEEYWFILDKAAT